MSELSGIKRQQRAMWSAGDYGAFAELLQPAADGLVARVDPQPGQDVLDVATGTGNAAIAAARAGATVTGLDLTPELFELARRRAAAGGWPIDWVEGDAEDLPFEDQSFDAVFSVFGAMFAPDHRRTAEELVRVCRSGGTVGVCAWTPQGAFGQMIRLLMSRAAKPPPAGFRPPALWGHEEYVVGLFDGLGVRLEFGLDQIAIEHDSAETWVAYLDRVFGPIVLVRSALDPAAWDGLRAELVDLYRTLNQATDGKLLVAFDYLTVIAHR